MSSRARAAVIVGAALVAAAAAWLAISAGEAETREIEGDRVRSARGVSASRTLDAPLADAQLATADAATASAREIASDEAPAEIAGRCVDAAGEPVADARVAAEAAPNHAATTGADGRFVVKTTAFRSRSRNEVWIVASKAGHADARAQAFVKPGSTFPIGDLALRPGGAISGRVVDQNGAPVRAASVSTRGGKATVESAADGAFRIEGVAAGVASLVAREADGPPSVSRPFEVRANEETRDVTLVVERARDDEVVDGIVKSPNGKPAGRAIVQYRAAERDGLPWTSASVDAAGRYRIRLAARTSYDLQARMLGTRLDSPIVRRVSAGTHGLDLVLREAKVLAFDVRDEAGEPVEEFAMECIDAAGRALPGDRGELSGRRARHAKGRAEALASGEPFRVRIDARGFSLEDAGPFDPDALPPSATVTLRGVPGVRGRVTAGGVAVNGARVFLLGPLIDSADATGAPVLRTDPRSAKDDEKQGDADANGAFFVPLRTPGRYIVRAEFAVFAPGEIGPIPIDPSSGVSGLEVSLTSGGVLEGRVLVADGDDPRGRTVVASGADGFSRSAAVQADGRFVLEHLSPGKWTASLLDGEGGALDWPGVRGPRVFSNALESREVFVGEGGLTRCDFDASRIRRPRVVGSLRLGGVPAAGWKARLEPSREAREATLDAQGAFALEGARPGSYELTLTARGADGADFVITDRLQLAAGDVSWSQDLAVGRLEGTIAALPSDPDPYVSFRWSGPRNLSASAQIRAGRDGRFALTAVPAGRATVIRKRAVDDGTTVVPVDVPAGGVARVEIP